MTVGDCWLLEGGRKRLRKRSIHQSDEGGETTGMNDGEMDNGNLPIDKPDVLPSNTSVSLLLVLVHCVEFEGTLPPKVEQPPEHYMRRLLIAKYDHYTEITADTTFPLTSLLKPLGKKGKVFFYSPLTIQKKIDELMEKENITDKDKAREMFIDRYIPGDGKVEVFRPFYLPEMIHQRLSHATVLAYTDTSSSTSGLIMIDPIRYEPLNNINENSNHYREYAATELYNKAALLSMLIVVSIYNYRIVIILLRMRDVACY